MNCSGARLAEAIDKPSHEYFSDFLQRLRRIPELRQARVHLVHHREIEPACVAFGLALMVEAEPSFDAPECLELHDWGSLL